MSKNKLTKRILFALGVGMLSLMPLASALPSQGAYDNSAVAAISTAGNTMSITGKNANNILNWLTFSVGKGETVRFTDKNNYLNLVNGFDISRIYGTISGGNNVYLVNPYGILFGQGATLDNVGSFVASTRDISDINKQAFLNDSANVQSVLYTDKNGSRNKDYYPDDSPYVPTVSVAEINLTNVPASATKIVLDGPGGVVLKNTELLDKVTQVSTRVNGGEVGIGSSNANVNLTDAQKSKISLFRGDSRFNFDFNPSVIKSYKLVTNVSGLQTMTNGNYLLGNNIDASSINNFRSKDYSGTFDGLGYKVSNLTITNGSGLFDHATGTIRNLNLSDVNIYGRNYIVGGIAGRFSGSMSNASVSGSVSSYVDEVGGLVGRLYTQDGQNSPSEIRNSHNDATVVQGDQAPREGVGGIVGRLENSSLYRVYNTGKIYGEQLAYVGGIVGETSNSLPLGQRILSAYNTGEVESHYYTVRLSSGKIIDAGLYASAGGIIGHYSGGIPIGDTYNLGTVKGAQRLGGIVGYVSDDTLSNARYVSKENGEVMDSYYNSNNVISEKENGTVVKGVDFGKVISSQNELSELLNKNWYGIGYANNSGTGDNSGEDYGGDSGSTGGNTGGNSGGSNDGNSGDNGGSTSGGTGESTSGGTSGGLTDDDIKDNIEKAKAKIASQEYNDIMTEIKKENEVVIPYDEKRIKPVLPTLKEESKKTERIFHVDPGYNQEGYNTDGGGLFVYNLNIDNDPNSETPITFDLYNTQNATGYIEYYDKDGKYITAERIDPFSPVIKSAKTFIERYEAVKESIQKNGLFGETDVTDKINSRGKTITAPPDTYKIVVTNNPATSRYAQASNFVDSLFETVDMVRTMKDAYEAFTALKGGAVELPVNQILENVRKEMIDKIAKEAMVTKEVVKGATKEAAKEAGLEFVLTLGQEGMQELLTNSLADTFKKHGGEIAFGAGKEAAKTMVGEMLKTNPGVLGLKLMEDIGKGMDGLSQKITEKKLENVRPMVFQLNY